MLLCIFIYVFCRPEDVLMQQVVAAILGQERLGEWKSLLNLNFADWIIYNLPGMLWLFSALFATGLVLKTKSIASKVIVAALISAVPIGMEICQLYHITDGTFDWLDLLFFGIAIILAPLLVKLFSVSLDKDQKHLWNWKWVAAFFISILIFGDRLPFG